jgi:hypothetical protein
MTSPPHFDGSQMQHSRLHCVTRVVVADSFDSCEARKARGIMDFGSEFVLLPFGHQQAQVAGDQLPLDVLALSEGALINLHVRAPR